MHARQVIAVYDIGKTNKKLFLFDEDYRIVYEQTEIFEESMDEDGDACEDLLRLQDFVIASLKKVFEMDAFEVKAVNFSAYGASMVHLDEKGAPLTPLYSYLKNYPEDLLRKFYDHYGGSHLFSVITASPVMGFLNSGMQLYWLKHARPGLFDKIHCSLHLPQYLSYLVSKKMFSELTSIGCHTNLWDFTKGVYHEWVTEEGVLQKLAPVVPSPFIVEAFVHNRLCQAGVGLHDSSAALIPYLATFPEPFVLISTGTWCISLNPFNASALTYRKLQSDCLCYLSYEGKPVLASRLFAGHEHEQQVKRLAAHFKRPAGHYKTVRMDASLFREGFDSIQHRAQNGPVVSLQESPFGNRDLSLFSSFEEGYHQLMQDILVQQVASTNLVLEGMPVAKIFVDGGFAQNEMYMTLLAAAYPNMEVYAASMAQASAMGAALAIHRSWNRKQLPKDVIELKSFKPTKATR